MKSGSSSFWKKFKRYFFNILMLIVLIGGVAAIPIGLIINNNSNSVFGFNSVQSSFKMNDKVSLNAVNSNNNLAADGTFFHDNDTINGRLLNLKFQLAALKSYSIALGIDSNSPKAESFELPESTGLSIFTDFDVAGNWIDSSRLTTDSAPALPTYIKLSKKHEFSVLNELTSSFLTDKLLALQTSELNLTLDEQLNTENGSFNLWSRNQSALNHLGSLLSLMLSPSNQTIFDEIEVNDLFGNLNYVALTTAIYNHDLSYFTSLNYVDTEQLISLLPVSDDDSGPLFNQVSDMIGSKIATLNSELEATKWNPFWYATWVLPEENGIVLAPLLNFDGTSATPMPLAPIKGLFTKTKELVNGIGEKDNDLYKFFTVSNFQTLTRLIVLIDGDAENFNSKLAKAISVKLLALQGDDFFNDSYVKSVILQLLNFDSARPEASIFHSAIKHKKILALFEPFQIDSDHFSVTTGELLIKSQEEPAAYQFLLAPDISSSDFFATYLDIFSYSFEAEATPAESEYSSLDWLNNPNGLTVADTTNSAAPILFSKIFILSKQEIKNKIEKLLHLKKNAIKKLAELARYIVALNANQNYLSSAYLGGTGLKNVPDSESVLNDISFKTDASLQQNTENGFVDKTLTELELTPHQLLAIIELETINPTAGDVAWNVGLDALTSNKGGELLIELTIDEEGNHVGGLLSWTDALLDLKKNAAHASKKNALIASLASLKTSNQLLKKVVYTASEIAQSDVAMIADTLKKYKDLVTAFHDFLIDDDENDERSLSSFLLQLTIAQIKLLLVKTDGTNNGYWASVLTSDVDSDDAEYDINYNKFNPFFKNGLDQSIPGESDGSILIDVSTDDLGFVTLIKNYIFNANLRKAEFWTAPNIDALFYPSLIKIFKAYPHLADSSLTDYDFDLDLTAKYGIDLDWWLLSADSTATFAFNRDLFSAAAGSGSSADFQLGSSEFLESFFHYIAEFESQDDATKLKAFLSAKLITALKTDTFYSDLITDDKSIFETQTNGQDSASAIALKKLINFLKLNASNSELTWMYAPAKMAASEAAVAGYLPTEWLGYDWSQLFNTDPISATNAILDTGSAHDVNDDLITSDFFSSDSGKGNVSPYLIMIPSEYLEIWTGNDAAILQVQADKMVSLYADLITKNMLTMYQLTIAKAIIWAPYLQAIERFNNAAALADIEKITITESLLEEFEALAGIFSNLIADPNTDLQTSLATLKLKLSTATGVASLIAASDVDEISIWDGFNQFSQFSAFLDLEELQLIEIMTTNVKFLANANVSLSSIINDFNKFQLVAEQGDLLWNQLFAVPASPSVLIKTLAAVWTDSGLDYLATTPEALSSEIASGIDNNVFIETEPGEFKLDQTKLVNNPFWMSLFQLGQSYDAVDDVWIAFDSPVSPENWAALFNALLQLDSVLIVNNKTVVNGPGAAILSDGLDQPSLLSMAISYAFGRLSEIKRINAMKNLPLLIEQFELIFPELAGLFYIPDANTVLGNKKLPGISVLNTGHPQLDLLKPLLTIEMTGWSKHGMWDFVTKFFNRAQTSNAPLHDAEELAGHFGFKMTKGGENFSKTIRLDSKSLKDVNWVVLKQLKLLESGLLPMNNQLAAVLSALSSDAAIANIDDGAGTLWAINDLISLLPPSLRTGFTVADTDSNPVVTATGSMIMFTLGTELPPFFIPSSAAFQNGFDSSIAATKSYLQTGWSISRAGSDRLPITTTDLVKLLYFDHKIIDDLKVGNQRMNLITELVTKYMLLVHQQLKPIADLLEGITTPLDLAALTTPGTTYFDADFEDLSTTLYLLNEQVDAFKLHLGTNIISLLNDPEAWISAKANFFNPDSQATASSLFMSPRTENSVISLRLQNHDQILIDQLLNTAENGYFDSATVTDLDDSFVDWKLPAIIYSDLLALKKLILYLALELKTDQTSPTVYSDLKSFDDLTTYWSSQAINLLVSIKQANDDSATDFAHTAYLGMMLPISDPNYKVSSRAQVVFLLQQLIPGATSEIIAALFPENLPVFVDLIPHLKNLISYAATGSLQQLKSLALTEYADLDLDAADSETSGGKAGVDAAVFGILLASELMAIKINLDYYLEDEDFVVAPQLGLNSYMTTGTAAKSLSRNDKSTENSFFVNSDLSLLDLTSLHLMIYSQLSKLKLASIFQLFAAEKFQLALEKYKTLIAELDSELVDYHVFKNQKTDEMLGTVHQILQSDSRDVLLLSDFDSDGQIIPAAIQKLNNAPISDLNSIKLNLTTLVDPQTELKSVAKIVAILLSTVLIIAVVFVIFLITVKWFFFSSKPNPKPKNLSEKIPAK